MKKKIYQFIINLFWNIINKISRLSMSTSKLINKLIICALLVAITFCIGPVQQLGSHNI